MRPVALSRLFTVVLVTCLIVLTLGILSFGAALLTNTIPSFDRRFTLSNVSSLDIKNGSACPDNMPWAACTSSGLAFRREFNISYRTPSSRNVLMVIELPNR
jgi:hypothetical protein